jgi:phosphomevalonate kinase
MKKIILISGKAGNGKDSVAKIIRDELVAKNQKVIITHYAKHMKDMLTEFYNWDGVKDEWARHKLQWMGTEKIRIAMNKPNFHVYRTCENIDIVQEDFDYFMVADCRFPNEIEYVKKYFGEENVVSIRVTRLNYESTLTPEAQLHPSETALDDWKDWDYNVLAMNNDWKGLGHQCALIVDKILK